MIAPLRARHRRVIGVLAIALPATFAVALATRSGDPRVAELPAAVATDAEPLPVVLRRHVQMHAGRVYSSSFGPDPLLVALVQEGGPQAADVLAYWSASEPRDGELAADALLLGAVGARERRFQLPEAARERGWLVLFSLGHGKIVASMALGKESGG